MAVENCGRVTFHFEFRLGFVWYTLTFLGPSKQLNIRHFSLNATFEKHVESSLSTLSSHVLVIIMRLHATASFGGRGQLHHHDRRHARTHVQKLRSLST